MDRSGGRFFKQQEAIGCDFYLSSGYNFNRDQYGTEAVQFALVKPVRFN
jgi:hypothetical protein